MSYRVENPENCTVIYGSVPLTQMVALLGSFGPDAVMDITLSNIMGATIVAGTPENLAKLKESCKKPRVPDEFRTLIGERACQWVESGKVGNSSNFVLYFFTGFNALSWLKNGSATKKSEIAHPYDIFDFSRCRILLEAESGFLLRLPELAPVSKEWAALVAQWSAICDVIDKECPTWRDGSINAPTANSMISAAISVNIADT